MPTLGPPSPVYHGVFESIGSGSNVSDPRRCLTIPILSVVIIVYTRFCSMAIMVLRHCGCGPGSYYLARTHLW